MAGELSEKYVEEMKREMERELMKLDKKFQEFKARVEEKEKLISRFWLERAVYISAIVAIATALVMIVV